ncbi:MAG TPA: hypothetical protein VIK84_05075 [Haloplasmataceae bacterium]
MKKLIAILLLGLMLFSFKFTTMDFLADPVFGEMYPDPTIEP